MKLLRCSPRRGRGEGFRGGEKIYWKVEVADPPPACDQVVRLVPRQGGMGSRGRQLMVTRRRGSGTADTMPCHAASICRRHFQPESRRIDADSFPGKNVVIQRDSDKIGLSVFSLLDEHPCMLVYTTLYIDIVLYNAEENTRLYISLICYSQATEMKTQPLEQSQA